MMTESHESNYSFTTKISGDLLTVRGNTADEFSRNLDGFLLSPALLGKVCDFQDQVRQLNGGSQLAAAEAALSTAGVTATTEWSQPAAPAPAAPAPQANAGGLEAVETVEDRFGNRWTYGLPNAPVGINGAFVLKEGKSQKGKPYKGWFDRSKGPKPCKVNGPAEAPKWDD